MANQTEHPHLTRAPIVEAMIGIHTDAINRSLLKRIEELNLEMQQDFPVVEEVTEFIETETGTTNRICGFRLVQRETKYAFSVTLTGFSFSRFAPYDTWEDLTGNAERIWNHYSSCFEPLSVKDFSIRFINELVIPTDVDIGKYLVATIHMPDGFVSNTASNMFLRLEMPLEKDNALLTLQQAFKGRMSDKEVAIILDYQLDYSALGMTRDRLWTAIKEKRNQKNQVFFSCITEEMTGKLL